MKAYRVQPDRRVGERLNRGESTNRKQLRVPRTTRPPRRRTTKPGRINQPKTGSGIVCYHRSYVSRSNIDLWRPIHTMSTEKQFVQADTPPDSVVMKVSSEVNPMHSCRIKGTLTQPNFGHPEPQSLETRALLEDGRSTHRPLIESPRRKEGPAAAAPHKTAKHCLHNRFANTIFGCHHISSPVTK